VQLRVRGSQGVPIGDEERAISDDQFAEFYQAQYRGALGLAYTLVGSLEAAEDVVQEVFTRMSGRFTSVDAPTKYLRVGVIHECQRHWYHRRKTAETRLPPREPIEPSASAELFDALLRLPYRQRAVLVLRYWADWSEAEIAEALGCRPGAVKSLASRGLSKLRQEIPR
jgi:RNA polymerase sigma factor (sigma-70 family)